MLTNGKMNSILNYSTCIVMPGYLVVSQDPILIGVVCGNGMTIFLRDRIKKIGGVAYYLYPNKSRHQRPSNYFADDAIYSLIRSILNEDSYLGNLEAQVYGGGHLAGHGKKRAEQCLKVTRKILRKLRIPIVTEDTGGSLGRKIVFNTHSGEAIVLKTPRIRRADWLPELGLRN